MWKYIFLTLYSRVTADSRLMPSIIALWERKQNPINLAFYISLNPEILLICHLLIMWIVEDIIHNVNVSTMNTTTWQQHIRTPSQYLSQRTHFTGEQHLSARNSFHTCVFPSGVSFSHKESLQKRSLACIINLFRNSCKNISDYCSLIKCICWF